MSERRPSERLHVGHVIADERLNHFVHVVEMGVKVVRLTCACRASSATLTESRVRERMTRKSASLMAVSLSRRFKAFFLADSSVSITLRTSSWFSRLEGSSRASPSGAPLASIPCSLLLHNYFRRCPTGIIRFTYGLRTYQSVRQLCLSAICRNAG